MLGDFDMAFGRHSQVPMRAAFLRLASCGAPSPDGFPGGVPFGSVPGLCLPAVFPLDEDPSTALPSAMPRPSQPTTRQPPRLPGGRSIRAPRGTILGSLGDSQAEI